LSKITKRTALFVANIVVEKKAKDLIILDMRKVTNITSFFIICTATSKIHIKTVYETLRDRLKQKGFSILNEEGTENSGWVLLDYGDIVIHIFDEDTRKYYNLESLWGDAKVLK
jgi:ribosome-associated protein